MPRHGRPGIQRGEGIPYLSGGTGRSGQGRHLAVCSDTTPGDPSHHLVDGLVTHGAYRSSSRRVDGRISLSSAAATASASRSTRRMLPFVSLATSPSDQPRLRSSAISAG